MAKLIVRKEDGTELFDTDKIAYGLVKSGAMVYMGNVNRFVCTTTQCRKDPSWGGNWTENGNYGDQTHGFTVTGAVNPIVFITGGGILIGHKTEGDVRTFTYTQASTNSKFYCFDLMRDAGSGPALRTWRDDGVLTFNSRQVPLNVVSAVRAPDRGAPMSNVRPFGWFFTVYAGGYNAGGVSNFPSSSVNIPLAGMGECAAFLPWSRAVTCAHENASTYQLSLTEGCFGTATGITFTCGVGRTSYGQVLPSSVPAYYQNPCFINIPIDRYPTALVIRTAGLPFPFEL